ncbi:MAG TPA: hypothetical protein VFV87_22310, partial [Pirellulaceae bacterium]|nr:hypothetical protein [Pirellulaceae bacterium]
LGQMDSTSGGPPSKVRALLALPAIFLLINLSLATWRSSQITDLTAGRSAAEACAAEQVSGPLRATCASFRLAVIGLKMSVLLVIIKLTAFGLSLASARLTWSGKVPLMPAAKFAYYVSVLGSFANILLSAGLYAVCTQGTLMRLFDVSYLEFDFAMVGFMMLVSAYSIWKIIDAQPLFPETSRMQVIGKAVNPDEQPALAAIVQRISEPLQSPIPNTVIYGLEPTVRCTRRPVDLDGTEISGLTLFVSLPLCRLLSEGELISLITGELARCELVSPDWEIWIERTYARWSVTAQSDRAAFFNLLWFWMEQWSTWSMILSLWCIQRSVVIAGRENAAAGLAISSLVQTKWPSYLNHVQLALREGTIDAARQDVNLSEGFATMMNEKADELVATYWQTDGPNTGLPSLIESLQADPVAISQRIASEPTERASDILVGLERLELELSADQMKRIFFT